jgi:hypothetical protein
MIDTPLYCVQILASNLCLAGIFYRNDVPTVVAFRTVLQAQRARQVILGETWRYDAWGQVIVMMPLKQLEINQPACIWRHTPPSLRRGINKFGVDVCEVGKDNTYTSHSPYLSINT